MLEKKCQKEISIKRKQNFTPPPKLLGNLRERGNVLQNVFTSSGLYEHFKFT